MTIDADKIKQLICDHIKDADVSIEDLTGNGDHYVAEVTAESFRDKTLVQQHQMVYSALGKIMGGALHALALHTHIPNQK